MFNLLIHVHLLEAEIYKNPFKNQKSQNSILKPNLNQKSHKNISETSKSDLNQQSQKPISTTIINKQVTYMFSSNKTSPVQLKNIQ